MFTLFMVYFKFGHLKFILGPCELQDYPEDGPPPHYWQYERTPWRQWWAKWVAISDMECHERNLSFYERNGILDRWRCNFLLKIF